MAPPNQPEAPHLERTNVQSRVQTTQTQFTDHHQHPAHSHDPQQPREEAHGGCG